MPPLIDTIHSILKDVCLNHSTLGKVNSSPRIVTRANTTISIDEHGVRSLYSIIRALRVERPQIASNFSEEHIENKLIDIVVTCHAVPSATLDSKLRKEIRSLMAKLQNTIGSWVFFVPIINMRFVNFRKFSIGLVDLYGVNLNTVKYLQSKFKAKIGHQSARKTFSELSGRGIAVLAIAKVEAGEIEKAKTKAVSTVETALNVLRLYNFTSKFGTQREFYGAFRNEELYWKNLTTSSSGSSLSALSIPQVYAFNLDKTMLNSMRKHQLSDFDRLLTKAPPTKLESKLLTSIHWYGLAIKDEQEVDRFVKLIVSLEALLLNKNNEPKKHMLGDRAAFILGKDKDARERVFDLVTKAYSLRGDIVHEGRIDFSKEEIDSLLAVLRGLIFKMARLSKKASGLEEISKKIKEIKFGSQVKPI
jgi:uncharacterized protein (UPF0332 family)